MSRLCLLIPRIFVLLAVLLFLISVEARGSTGCLGVKGKWITAGDLARVIPEFAKIDAASTVVAAPSGLSRRWITAVDIDAIASRLGLGPFEKPLELCLEQERTEVSRDLILEQLAAQLSTKGAGGEALIELISFFPKQSPRGNLRFDLSGLAPACIAGGCGFYRWKGTILLDEGGSIPITAQVRIEVIDKFPIAERDLPLGVKIGVHDFSIVESRHPWLPFDARSELDLSGYIVQRPVKTGAVISSRAVRKPQEVEKGEMVELHVKSGPLELVTQAKAETSGKTGDRVVVSNPTSRRKFMAEVTGPGRARTLSQGDGL